jgi:hypothetical protein
MYYIYTYVDGMYPYYVGKGKGNRAWRPETHPPLPDKDKIHLIAHFDDNVKALLREWELITFLGLRSEGGMLVNQVKGMNPPDRTGKTHKLSEKTKMKLRKPKNYVRTPEHSEKIAIQNRGKKHTEEHRRRISEGLLGNKNNIGKTNRALTYQVTHPNGETELVYNMATFCEAHNLSRPCMCNVAKGKQKQHRKYKVRYWDK